MEVFYRFSRIGDEENVNKIMVACFGARQKALKHIDGRYLLACVDGIPVAMSGLAWNDDYRGLEMDWTGTLPEYRHTGIMQEIFRRLLSTTDEDIYCSCWRLSGKDRVNLQIIMDMFDFESVVVPRATWVCGVNCNHSADTCTSCTGKDCRCYEDLYVRKGEF